VSSCAVCTEQLLLDEVTKLFGGFVTALRVAREPGKAVSQVGIVDICHVVAVCRELSCVGVTNVAQWVKPIGNEDRWGQIGV
jgi:hypothetical protein